MLIEYSMKGEMHTYSSYQGTFQILFYRESIYLLKKKNREKESIAAQLSAIRM